MEDEGVIANAEARFRRTLAQCQTIRDWSRNGEPIIFEEADPRRPEGRDEFGRDELIANRPFIVVYSLSFDCALIAEPGEYRSAGEMEAMFEMNSPPNATDEDVFRHFKRFMGLVIRDLRALAVNSQEGWTLPTLMTIDGPERSAPEDRVAVGDFLRYYLRVRWGVTR